MKVRIIGLWSLLFSIGAVDSFAEPAKLAQVSSPVNVRTFGAVGDGKTDETATIQQALNAVGKAGGGVVQVSAGNYRIEGHITVPDEVTLEGVWTVPTAWTQFKGTTLLVEEGHGHKDGPPFITLGQNSVVRGLTIYYHKQDKNNIAPYPWCVALSPGSRPVDNASIVDVLMVNPYKGVNFDRGGRHYIRNLYGQPLRIGIQVDRCFDVGRIENVHFWPFWTFDRKTKVPQFMEENGEAFVFARTDWQYCTNTFCWGYKVGYRFTNLGHGVCNGNFLGIGADATNIAVKVEQAAEYGLLITNGEFVSFTGTNPTEVVVSHRNTGVVQFSNCAFWGPADRIASIKGTGAVSFTQCNFCQWDRHGKGHHAIQCLGGDLTISACRFGRDEGQDILLGRSVRSATIFGNVFARSMDIEENAPGPVEIGLNVETNKQ